MFFGYVIVSCFSSSRMWQISSYFRDEKLLEYTVGLFSIESNRIHPEYYFLSNTELDTKYYLEKYFKNII